MKKNYLLAGVMAATLAMTVGCSNDEPANTNQDSPKDGITRVVATMPQGAPSTRLTYEAPGNISDPYVVKWSAGTSEKFYAISKYNTEMVGYRYEQQDLATPGFSATFNIKKWYDISFGFPYFDDGSIYVDDKVHAIYPAVSLDETKFHIPGGNIADVPINLQLGGQTGNLDEMWKFDYMTAIGVVGQEGASTDLNDAVLTLNFKHRVAFLRLTGMTLDGINTSTTASEISISATSGLYTSATLTIKPDVTDTPDAISFETANTLGTITTSGSTFNVSSTGVLDDVYICFFPGNANAAGSHEITGLKITAKVGSDTYEYSYGDDDAVTTKVTKFVEGKMYTLSGKAMTKKVEEDFIEIKGLKWAKGNLVANGANGAKIGEPTDDGLIFQFGSLVGWNTTGTATVVVSPDGYTTSSWNSSWTVNSIEDNASAGTGDPCRYYLKGTWRLPTKEEYAILFSNTSTGWTGATGWSYETSYAFHTSGLKLKVVKGRETSGVVTSYDDGFYWSSSFTSGIGYCLAFNGSDLQTDAGFSQANGYPVRCIQASN